MKIILFLLAISNIAVASPSADRFRTALNDLENSLHKAASDENFGDASKEDKTKELIKSGVRLNAFYLQSLARLYENYPKKSVQEYVSGVREHAKLLEDVLGTFDKYKSVSKKEEAKEAAKKALKAIYEVGWLDKDGKSPLAKKLKKDLDQQKWPSEKEDRKFIIERLAGHLNSIGETDYDMSLLEGGLHELRRDIRWFPIYGKVLNGMIQTKNSGNFECALDKIVFAPFAVEKYSTLPRNEMPNVCYISKCNFEEIAGAVEVFGRIKDEAEPIFENDDQLLAADLTPPELAEEAKRYYKALRKSQVLEKTRDQVLECLE